MVLTRRRLEALLLVLTSIALVAVELDALTVTVAYLLVGGVFFLMWRNFEEQKRENASAQLEDLDQLLLRGLRLHANQIATDQSATSWDKSRDFALIRYDMEKWIDGVKIALLPYPEFAGIFEACNRDDMLLGFRDRVRRLSEIRRLISLSVKVGFDRSTVPQGFATSSKVKIHRW